MPSHEKILFSLQDNTVLPPKFISSMYPSYVAVQPGGKPEDMFSHDAAHVITFHHQIPLQRYPPLFQSVQ